MARRSALRKKVDDALTDFNSRLLPALRTAKPRELRRLREQVEAFGTTDCWWFAYELKPVLLAEIDAALGMKRQAVGR